MFTRYAMGATAAVLCSMSMGVLAAQAPATAAKPGAQMFEGCLVRAQDVPGHSPNVANPAGATDEFVLLGSRTAAAGTSCAATPGAVGTSGGSTPNATDRVTTATTNVGPIYKIAGISGETLASLVGKRVEVNGSLNRAAAFDRDADSVAISSCRELFFPDSRASISDRRAIWRLRLLSKLSLLLAS